jgi:hypothetical protein
MEQQISLVTPGITDLARARASCEAPGWRGARQPDDEACFFQAGGMMSGLWTRWAATALPRDRARAQRALTRARRRHHPPQHRLTGAEQQERAGAAATCGKWPATPAGPSTKTAQYTSDPRAGPIPRVHHHVLPARRGHRPPHPSPPAL